MKQRLAGRKTEVYERVHGNATTCTMSRIGFLGWCALSEESLEDEVFVTGP